MPSTALSSLPSVDPHHRNFFLFLNAVTGLLYFVLKHCVDKHNLCWVYTPSEIDKKVHRLVIKLVIFSVVLLQLFQTVVSYLR